MDEVCTTGRMKEGANNNMTQVADNNNEANVGAMPAHHADEEELLKAAMEMSLADSHNDAHLDTMQDEMLRIAMEKSLAESNSTADLHSLQNQEMDEEELLKVAMQNSLQSHHASVMRRMAPPASAILSNTNTKAARTPGLELHREVDEDELHRTSAATTVAAPELAATTTIDEEKMLKLAMENSMQSHQASVVRRMGPPPPSAITSNKEMDLRTASSMLDEDEQLRIAMRESLGMEDDIPKDTLSFSNHVSKVLQDYVDNDDEEDDDAPRHLSAPPGEINPLVLHPNERTSSMSCPESNMPEGRLSVEDFLKLQSEEENRINSERRTNAPETAAAAGTNLTFEEIARLQEEEFTRINSFGDSDEGYPSNDNSTPKHGLKKHGLKKRGLKKHGLKKDDGKGHYDGGKDNENSAQRHIAAEEMEDVEDFPKFNFVGKKDCQKQAAPIESDDKNSTLKEILRFQQGEYTRLASMSEKSEAETETALPRASLLEADVDDDGVDDKDGTLEQILRFQQGEYTRLNSLSEENKKAVPNNSSLLGGDAGNIADDGGPSTLDDDIMKYQQGEYSRLSSLCEARETALPRASYLDNNNNDNDKAGKLAEGCTLEDMLKLQVGEYTRLNSSMCDDISSSHVSDVEDDLSKSKSNSSSLKSRNVLTPSSSRRNFGKPPGKLSDDALNRISLVQKERFNVSRLMSVAELNLIEDSHSEHTSSFCDSKPPAKEKGSSPKLYEKNDARAQGQLKQSSGDAVAGTATAVAGTATAVAGTATAVAGTATSVAGTATAAAPSRLGGTSRQQRMERKMAQMNNPNSNTASGGRKTAPATHGLKMKHPGDEAAGLKTKHPGDEAAGQKTKHPGDEAAGLKTKHPGDEAPGSVSTPTAAAHHGDKIANLDPVAPPPPPPPPPSVDNVGSATPSRARELSRQHRMNRKMEQMNNLNTNVKRNRQTSPNPSGLAGRNNDVLSQETAQSDFISTPKRQLARTVGNLNLDSNENARDAGTVNETVGNLNLDRNDNSHDGLNARARTGDRKVGNLHRDSNDKTRNVGNLNRDSNNKTRDVLNAGMKTGNRTVGLGSNDNVPGVLNAEVRTGDTSISQDGSFVEVSRERITNKGPRYTGNESDCPGAYQATGRAVGDLPTWGRNTPQRSPLASPAASFDSAQKKHEIQQKQETQKQEVADSESGEIPTAQAVINEAEVIVYAEVVPEEQAVPKKRNTMEFNYSSKEFRGENSERNDNKDQDPEQNDNENKGSGSNQNPSNSNNSKGFNSFLKSLQWKKKNGGGGNSENSSSTKAKGGKLDARASAQISHAIETGIIDVCISIGQQGESSSIYHADGGHKCKGYDVAIKVLNSIPGQQQHDNVKDDQDELTKWTKREYDYLKRAAKGDVPVPKPLAHEKSVIFMKFIGSAADDEKSAPKLRELDIRKGNKKWRSLYYQTIEAMRRLYVNAKLVHGSLNECNILISSKPVVENLIRDGSNSHNNNRESNNNVVFIDFKHAIEANHPHALFVLEEDVKRIRMFFSKQAGVKVHNFDDLLAFVMNQSGSQIQYIDEMSERTESGRRGGRNLK